MYLGLPQIVYLALVVLSLGITAANHGRPREEKYNFFVTFIAAVVDISIVYWGGFFK